MVTRRAFRRPLPADPLAGLTVEEATGLSPDEIAAHKFSREASDSYPAIRPASRALAGPARAFFAAGLTTAPVGQVPTISAAR
jgi:hypothetical protein